jgi:hypothetical protein
MIINDGKQEKQIGQEKTLDTHLFFVYDNQAGDENGENSGTDIAL